MSFGSRLKDRREALGLKQSELGRLLNITGSAIGNYENGFSFPKADVLYKVFDVLQCDANYLFQDEMNDAQENSQTIRERKLLDSIRQLNVEGQEKVIEYADDLVCSGKYIKSSSAITDNAS